ncbi:FAD:protein FMN transferase [Hyphomicrobium sp.]|uniref:FAD:protein FMN transferase n=1 Tax=Hyphomicrobium sp. TaxID=82 RepID=UPI003F6EF37C
MSSATAGKMDTYVHSGGGERRVLIPHDVALPPSFAALRVLQMKEFGGETMGTSWSVKIAVPASFDVAPLAREIEGVLAGIVDEMSPWEPNSHLSRFNAAASGTSHRLPPGFFKVLSAALHWARMSNGAFDPTVGAAVGVWGFGPGARTSEVPDQAAIEAARADQGWRSVTLDRPNRTAVQPGGVALDLCGIAKGYAVDEVAKVLRTQGIGHMLVEIGGELRGEGLKPDGAPWWIAFERPRGAISGASALPDMLLALTGRSVATSGDERRYFERGGRRYAHTIDPRSGTPVAHDLVSVTVVAEACMTADAAATALTVLGPEQGPAFAERHGLAARFVRYDGKTLSEQLSPAMRAMLD